MMMMFVMTMMMMATYVAADSISLGGRESECG